MLDDLLVKLETDLQESRQIISVFKSTIQTARQQLAENIKDNVPAETLVDAHSAFMDGIMRLAWLRFNWHENTTSWRKSRISLIAVGGYGRRELLPHSDIDLLILLERNNHGVHIENIQSFTTLLWDIGLEVGHSVRTVKECRGQSAEDVTVLTALIEARTILGSDELFSKMNKQITVNKVWPSKDFYLAKKSEQDGRHAKSAHTEFSLQPNLKTSPGGLRDIQTLTWVARRQYGVKTFSDMVEAGILTPLEREQLTTAQRHLWRIRFALHTIAGRDENRLLFEHQQSLADFFDYKDGDQLAVEQFMQSYYRTAERVNAINETLMQHFNETIVQQGSSLQVRPINERFQRVNSLLEVTSDSVFVETPSALLEMFVIVGSDESIDGFRASTIRLATQHVHLLDEDFRSDPVNTAFFMQLLGSNNHLFTQLRRMGRWGILGAYLPEFGRVIGQMQFDLFHIYTVDAHILQVVRHMRRFRYKNQEQQFPIAAHIHPRLPKVELLYIAGLYHDIAKGMGGDHSELGIDIAKQFCERHQLTSWDINLVCWLVQNHLVMSSTAQRKDIQDPEIIHDFAVFVGDQVRLDYLYALTVADINATNPTLWNGWRASLLAQLYSETKKALRHGLENHIDRSEYIRDIQDQALEKLEEHALDRPMITRLWNEVDDDYFVRARVPDIVAHAEAIIKADVSQGPVVLIYDDNSRRSDTGFTQVFIHTQNRKDLFVSIVAAIDQLGLDIVDAAIATSASNLTFNTFTILENDGQPVGEKPTRIEKIRSTISHYLQQSETESAHTRRTPRALKQFKQKTQVNYSKDPHLLCAAIEVITPDRPGLLNIIARVFVELAINLVSARITTLGERVEDVFYVTHADGSLLLDDATMDELRSRICRALDEHVQQIAS